MTTKPLSVSDRSLALWLVHKRRYKVLVETHPAHRVITRSQRTPLAWGPGIQDHLPISKWILHVRLCSNLAQYLETKSQLPNFLSKHYDKILGWVQGLLTTAHCGPHEVSDTTNHRVQVGDGSWSSLASFPGLPTIQFLVLHRSRPYLVVSAPSIGVSNVHKVKNVPLLVRMKNACAKCAPPPPPSVYLGGH